MRRRFSSSAFRRSTWRGGGGFIGKEVTLYDSTDGASLSETDRVTSRHEPITTFSERTSRLSFKSPARFGVTMKTKTSESLFGGRQIVFRCLGGSKPGDSRAISSVAGKLAPEEFEGKLTPNGFEGLTSSPVGE